MGDSRRDIFNSAAEAVGAAASSSLDVILPELLKNKGETLKVTAIRECLERCLINHKEVSNETITAVYDFLTTNTSIDEINSPTVAESLRYVAMIENKIPERLLAIARDGDAEKASLATKALEGFVLRTENKDLALETLRQMVPLLERKMTIVSEGVLGAARRALTEGDKIGVEIANKAMEMMRYLPEHSKVIEYGLKKETVDFGKQQRLNALELVIEALRERPEDMDNEKAMHAAVLVLGELKKQGVECTEKALELVMQAFKADLPQIKDGVVGDRLRDLKSLIDDTNVGFYETKQSLMKVVAFLQKNGVRNSEVDNLFESMNSDPEMEKIIKQLDEKVEKKKVEEEKMSTVMKYVKEMKPQALTLFSSK